MFWGPCAIKQPAATALRVDLRSIFIGKPCLKIEKREMNGNDDVLRKQTGDLILRMNVVGIVG